MPHVEDLVVSAGAAPVAIADTTIHGFIHACDELGWKIRHNISCREIEVFFEGEWRVLSEKHLLSRIVDTLALHCQLLNKDGTRRVAKFTRQNVEQHLETLSECNRYDELGHWLKSLPDWDREDRISGLFEDMFEAEDTELNRWAANAVFWQVVDRIEKCQHGRRGESHRATVLFAGPQTVGKTAFVRELLPPHLRPRYLVEGLNFRMGRDELLRICSGRLLVEVGEFGVGADLEDTKAFITAARDNVNHKYQRPYTTPRSFVMLGGFNPEQDSPLARDLSGNTRFVVVEFNRRCDDVPAYMTGVRDQLWAQAWHQYHQLPDHYRWVPDSLAGQQAQLNRQHEYVNEALAEAAHRVFGATSGVERGHRFSLSDVVSRLAGHPEGDFVEPDRMSPRFQSEAKKTLVQTGLFQYERTSRRGRGKPYVYVGEGKSASITDFGEGVSEEAGSSVTNGEPGVTGGGAVTPAPSNLVEFPHRA